MASFVIGVFKSESDAEKALNNLAEADFQNDAVSVITDHQETTKTLQGTTNPQVTLRDIAQKLTDQTLAKKMMNMYKKMQEAAVILAIQTDDTSEADAASEILADQNGQK